MTLLNVESLVMYYRTSKGSIAAIDDVSFSLHKGKTLAIVGESGCGKSSIAYAILRLLPSNSEIIKGKIIFDNIDLLSLPKEEFRKKIRWQRLSIIPQGSLNSLNPVHKILDQIVEPILIHEKTLGAKATKRAVQILKTVGIDVERATSYPHEFSGGMNQRAVIAMALACNPDILIADEPTTALDVIVQAQVMRLLKGLQRELKLSLILISHDLSIVAEVCDKIAIMYAGKLVEISDARDFFREPLHPYSILLLQSSPSIEGEIKRQKPIPGLPPDLLNPPKACRFHPRCTRAKRICRIREPPLTELKERRYVACHFPGGIIR